jgi:uncharacterized membrane protein YgdD (TMEM256/DUF423 family)
MNTDDGRGTDILIAFAAIAAGSCVALGAYGSHVLDADADIKLMWDKGVTYQMWHSLGAIAAALLATQRLGKARILALTAGWAMLLGGLVFASILYHFAIYGTIYLHGAAPMGGYMMMAGWLGVAVAALWRHKSLHQPT